MRSGAACCCAPRSVWVAGIRGLFGFMRRAGIMKNINLVHTIPADRRCIVVDGQDVMWMLCLLWPIASLCLACHRAVNDSHPATSPLVPFQSLKQPVDPETAWVWAGTCGARTGGWG